MPLPSVFPAALNAFPHPGSGTYADDAGFFLDEVIDQLQDAGQAYEAKLGSSESSAQDSPLANTVLASLTNGKSKWAPVVTAMLAAHAVTQSGFAAGVSSSPTTTSTSFVDLPDMSITLTTGGGDLLVVLVGTFANSTAGAGVFAGLRLDSGGDVSDNLLEQTTANFNGVLVSIAQFTSVSAASHTIKGRWRVGAGTGTALTTRRTLLVVELRR